MKKKFLHFTRFATASQTIQFTPNLTAAAAVNLRENSHSKLALVGKTVERVNKLKLKQEALKSP